MLLTDAPQNGAEFPYELVEKKITHYVEHPGPIKPPPPKVKMTNLMRVLGDEALANPSMVEKKVRKQMQERIDQHEARNAAQKANPEDKRKKKIAKWKDA